jgi:L-iditol 2-dehydrogenase
VLDVGPGVKGFKPGDLVTAHAGHASHVVVRAELVAPVPDGIDAETAAFSALGLIALLAVRRSRIELGESVAVIGQGQVGLIAAQLARLQGASPLWVVDPLENRLDLGRKVGGADCAVAPEQAIAQAGNLRGGGATVVIEATGSPGAVNLALKLVRKGGRVVLIGSTRGETTVNFYTDVHRKGIDIHGVHISSRPPHDSRPGAWTQADDYEVLMELIRNGRLNVAPLISHRFAPQDAARAYQLLKTGDSTLLACLFMWRDHRGDAWTSAIKVPGRRDFWPPVVLS